MSVINTSFPLRPGEPGLNPGFLIVVISLGVSLYTGDGTWFGRSGSPATMAGLLRSGRALMRQSIRDEVGVDFGEITEEALQERERSSRFEDLSAAKGRYGFGCRRHDNLGIRGLDWPHDAEVGRHMSIGREPKRRPRGSTQMRLGGVPTPAWLTSNGKSPHEQALKRELRQLLAK